MYFDPNEKQSQLSRVTCDGSAVIKSQPLPVAGKLPPDSHVLRSEHIVMNMRPGGRDIETVTANPSGDLEFLPNQPAGHHRTLHGDGMLITYAPQNRIETFHATSVKTTTDPNAEERKHNGVVYTTSSKDFSAHFNPDSSTLATMEQKGDFSYQRGDRKAHADRATFDQKQNVMTLDTGAAFSDATGSTTADHIRLDEATDDFIAEGNVNSVRLPDKDPKNNSAMLSGDSPMNAQAGKMESSNKVNNRHTRYEGNAKLWQGANRITADVVEIDRDKHMLTANGNVVTEAWEQPKDDAKKKTSAVKTVVKAPHLVYTDQDRLAHYFGDVTLKRPELNLKSKELHAWLADSKADSQLEKAFADGAVEISGARRTTTYNGKSEHLEYYTTGQEVILTGGSPKLVETTPGKQPTVITSDSLIYFLDDGAIKSTGAATDRIPPKKK
jgi:lipopolysaccharide export system protein LptA